MKQKSTAVRKKSRRRTKAQMEADRRLTSLRKNLAKEIEADFDRFSGDKPSVTAGLLVLAKMRIILAFLQAFFPMFISAPKPRKIKRSMRGGKGVGRTRKKRSNARARQSRTTSRKRASVTKGLRIVKLKHADSTPLTSGWVGEISSQDMVRGDNEALVEPSREDAGRGFQKDEDATNRLDGCKGSNVSALQEEVGSEGFLRTGEITPLNAQDQAVFSACSRKNGKTYFLHSRTQKLNNGKESTLYFFSRQAGDGVVSEIPPGYEVLESEKTGLPILKKKVMQEPVNE